MIFGVYGVIYKITNLINGKTYVGQTTKTGKTLDNYLGSGKILKQAIKKYERNNFSKIILETCFNKKQLDIMERFYIELLKPDYNIANGGQGGNLGEAVNKKLVKHKQDIWFQKKQKEK